MRRLLMSTAAVLVLAGSTGASARTTTDDDREEECRDYCAEMAARRCDDVSSSWCSVYIVGCLAGCGVANC